MFSFMPGNNRGRWLLATLLVLAGCASDPDTPPPQYNSFTDSLTAPTNLFNEMPGVTARRLSTDPGTGRITLRLELPFGWRFNSRPYPNVAREWYVLAGTLQADGQTLNPGDTLRIPAQASSPSLTAVRGSTALLFLNPLPVDDDAAASAYTPGIATRTEARNVAWVPGESVPALGLLPGSQAKALGFDEHTGASTWLVRLPAGKAPGRWWRNAAPSEGFMISGRMSLQECIEGQPVEVSFEKGGYFWRPQQQSFGGDLRVESGGSVWVFRYSGETALSRVATCGQDD